MPSRPLAFDPIEEARGQWIAHGWRMPSHMAAATSVMRAQQIVLGRVDTALRPFGLTFARYEVLVLLHFSRRGSLPLGKMGDLLMVHPASITNAIDRLERDGLVRRTPHPTDGRTVLAEITADGRERVLLATCELEDISFGLGELGEESAESAERVTELGRELRHAVGDFTCHGPRRSGGSTGLLHLDDGSLGDEGSLDGTEPADLGARRM
jgi:DNA-binding MarR family transcriptional regulator